MATTADYLSAVPCVDHQTLTAVAKGRYLQGMPDGDDSRRTTAEVIETPLLSSLWKKSIRRRLRQTRFPDFVLGHDPLEWAAVDWEIEEIILAVDSSERAHRAAVRTFDWDAIHTLVTELDGQDRRLDPYRDLTTVV